MLFGLVRILLRSKGRWCRGLRLVEAADGEENEGVDGQEQGRRLFAERGAMQRLRMHIPTAQSIPTMISTFMDMVAAEDVVARLVHDGVVVGRAGNEHGGGGVESWVAVICHLMMRVSLVLEV